MSMVKAGEPAAVRVVETKAPKKQGPTALDDYLFDCPPRAGASVPTAAVKYIYINSIDVGPVCVCGGLVSERSGRGQ